MEIDLYLEKSKGQSNSHDCNSAFGKSLKIGSNKIKTMPVNLIKELIFFSYAAKAMRRFLKFVERL